MPQSITYDAVRPGHPVVTPGGRELKSYYAPWIARDLQRWQHSGVTRVRSDSVPLAHPCGGLALYCREATVERRMRWFLHLTGECTSASAIGHLVLNMLSSGCGMTWHFATATDVHVAASIPNAFEGVVCTKPQH